MAHSSKPRCLTYLEATHAFADPDVQEDINDACNRLGQAMALLVERFARMAKDLHTIDLKKLDAPFKPRWDVLSKDLGDLLCLYRNNAGYISGRLKLLPVAARNMSGRSRRSYQETVQILQSFVTLSSEHFARTRSLVERALALSQQVSMFHAEFAKFVALRRSDGQKEIYDVAAKVSDVEAHTKQTCIMNAELSRPDITHLAFSVFRIVSSSGRRPNRSKIPQQRMAMSENMLKVTQAYHALELKGSELAHAQYTAQIRMHQTDCLGITQSTVASLACDTMLSLESGLALFLSIWARLRSDCGEILQWLHAATPTEPPQVLIGYQECGPSLYVALSNAVDSCVSSIDPSAIARAMS
ncbi:hypothetical protein DFP72DRAFT_850558 [Ephemerocybe angulata]|uniref:Uncharacterized protein n=1 Tax=Ephemerocybe angulata TaxID=980116 RepID=A0A8H6HSR3_9AGAR|nr:hypothetical protein DFP72DRAFT_850558 [Tulosesus angulatus]